LNADAIEPRRATDDTLPPGSLFGRYEVVRRLGRGGAGSVYEARHVDLQKPVALKMLHAEHAGDARMRERFLFEGKATSRLRHPHVVDVSDYGVQDGSAFLVMEYLDGEDLASLLQREGALPVERIVELLLPICAGVSAAHEAGIVHRDLKPENIFLARNALGQVQPKVLDFGISKVIDGRNDPRDTSSGDLIGTPYYMSPEQAQGAGDADARSDQYALGVILYECATGRLPFDATTLYALLRQISTGAYPTPRGVRPELPPRFERVILRAMHPSLARRYPSVLALARDLLAFAPAPARNTWESILTPPGRLDDPMGEDPTSTFVSPLRLSGVSLRAPASPLSDTFSPSPRAITAPTPKARAPRPARGSRGTWVVAVSALCTVLAVGAAVHVRRACLAPVAHAAARARVAVRPPPAFAPAPAPAPLPQEPAAVVAALPAVAAPAASAASVARSDEPTDRGARPPRSGRHHRLRKTGGAGAEG